MPAFQQDRATPRSQGALAHDQAEWFVLHQDASTQLNAPLVSVAFAEAEELLPYKQFRLSVGRVVEEPHPLTLQVDLHPRRQARQRRPQVAEREQ